MTIDTACAAPRKIEFYERLFLPPFRDLVEYGLPPEIACIAERQIVKVKICLAPNKPVTIEWRDPRGVIWQLPNWRRRRILLPSYEVLIAQGIPADVAARFAGKTTTVNHHPGATCCLRDQYRVWDEEHQQKWAVRISDCVLVDYGDGDEHRA